MNVAVQEKTPRGVKPEENFNLGRKEQQLFTFSGNIPLSLY